LLVAGLCDAAESVAACAADVEGHHDKLVVAS
jgi:hypothetical protein